MASQRLFHADILYHHSIPSNTEEEAVVLLDKLGGSALNLAKRDLLRESTKGLILDRQKKIGANNIGKVWIVAGVAIFTFLFGNSVGARYANFERRKLFDKKVVIDFGKTA